MVSHGDNDHSGGLGSTLSAHPAATYITSDLSILPEQQSSEEYRKGESWHWDGVNFEILYPDRDGYSSNNSSCVLHISNGKHSVLLTDDIEAKVERYLLAIATNINADILLAPHHGSKPSSTKRFIEAVSPDYVVFSSGYLNQFNHPHPDIVNLYINSGTVSLNTTQTGTISWVIGMAKHLPGPSLYRQTNKRFWRLLP